MKHWAFRCVLCVTGYVCQLISGTFLQTFALADTVVQADKIDVLEKTHGWREDEFDFVLQYLRTILMKRASLILNLSIILRVPKMAPP